MSEIRVLERYIYPVRSLPGIRLPKMEISEAGPVLDRQWMLVDEKNALLTLKQRPELALFRVTLGNFMELTWKDGDSMDFGLSETEGEAFKVKTGDGEVEAQEVSEEVSAWISEKLDKKVRLVRQTDQSQKEAHPVQVISKASLELLDMKLGKKVAVSRFRPNLVVDALDAHQEDLIEGFYIGKVEFHFVKKTPRDEVIQTNPLTGKVEEEPMKTLNAYRKEDDGNVYFGSYFATQGVGTV
jgi:uncharacterized protein YcbX